MAVEKIQATDSLNDGRVKLNAAIEQSNEAITKATSAETTANQAKSMAENVQAQLNQAVIAGDSGPEAAQARVGADGTVYETLKERLDAEYNGVNDGLTQARVGADGTVYETLKERLDAEYLGVNDRLDSEYANIADQISNLDQQKLSKDSLPYVFVDLFGAKGDGVTDDTQAIQNAINSVYEKSALVFRAGGKYRITSTITIDASKIRMLKGFNSYIMVDGDFDGIHYKGNKTFKGTAPDGNVNTLKYDEIFNIVQGLQFYGIPDSETGLYRGRGLVIEDQHSPVVTDCHFFNLDHGLEIRGMNTRNIVISNTNFWDNRTTNISFAENGEVHQCLISNSHISYAKLGIHIGKGHKMYNLHLSNIDMEAQENQNDGFERFIFFEGDVNDEILFSNVTFQDHQVGTGELIRIENFRRLIFDGVYVSNSIGKGIYLINGESVIVDGIFERLSDAIEFVNVQDIKIEGLFKNLTGGCVRGRGTTNRINIQGIQGYDVDFIARIVTTTSILGGVIGNNLGHPRSVPFIEVKTTGTANIRNLNIESNSLYRFSDSDYNSSGYAISISSENIISGVVFKGNNADLRSNHSVNGINGFEISAPYRQGIIAKDNIVSQLKKSKGRIAFNFPSTASDVIVADNLSVREV